jgi:hypothetical protein
MSNIVQFKPRSTPPEATTVGGFEVVPDAALPPNTFVIRQPKTPPIADTAAGQVVEALMFYARQGWDGGEKAKKALTAMETVLNSQEVTPERA